MRTPDDSTVQIIHLEAPGDFLSELLGVSEACILSLLAGEVREPPDAQGLWRVVAPLSGGVQIAAGEQSLPLSAGQAAAFDGREELTLLPTEDCRLGMISLGGYNAERCFRACSEQGGLFFERGGEPVARTLRLLSARPGKILPAREASEHAFSLLMSLYGTGSAGPVGQRALPPVVEAALGIIRRDYAFLEGIAELADRLEVSQEYLTRCFCKYTGFTPGKYLTQVRIENAKLLLRQGQHSIQFVSDACGFANANYFARVFRTSVGVNPRDYAREQSLLPGAAPAEDRLYVL